MITITEVKTLKEKKEFIKFSFKLYKDNPYWIPPLISDELENSKYTLEYSEIGYKNFAVILTKIKSIEWLYLAAKGHRRAKFEYQKDTIKKYWLTP